jgi:multidrug efflux pump subunit AcrA (membrane-fusion protein)
MGKLVLTNVTAQYGGVDVSGQTNSLEVQATVAQEVSTTFASAGWEELLGGIVAFKKLMLKGFWDANTVVGPGEPDQTFFNDLGTLVLFSATVTRPQAQSDVAYFGQTLEMTYQIQNQVGKLAGYQLDGSGSGKLVRGKVLDASTQTATGTGTGVTFPAASATQAVYAGIHVTAESGTAAPSLVMTVQSDATGDAWASPTTRFTFPTFNAYGWAFMSLAGPITDTSWRTKWTITGTTPSFTYTVLLGIA